MTTIGITTSFGEKGAQLAEAYWASVRRAGATPILLVPTEDEEEMRRQLDLVDGLILSGGGDIDPKYFDEEPSPKLGETAPKRDPYELPLVRMAFDRNIPIMGICRGHQVMAVALGGKMCQDINEYLGHESPVIHKQDAARCERTHKLIIDGPSRYIGENNAMVNSFHHQAVTDPGPHMRVVAHAEDGIIEAMENLPHESFLFGVQWHPECLDDLVVFQEFLKAAETYCHALELHDRIITLDSHCDTPMIFDKLLKDADGDENVAFNLSKRNPKVCVDAEKMDDGHLERAFMVAYIPQRQRDAQGYENAKALVKEVYRRLDRMIELTPALEGRIYRGIENGYAIGKDLRNLEEYQKMGCRYLTLCHNGHNDICDSAKPKPGEPLEEWGGLSPFGREVVKEMNRLGMLIDLSHASEKTFYDVLELSEKPVAVTHASCRALCDHPRNLSDDQLRAIAAKDGVVQVTMYPGFLKEDGEANFTDFIAHLLHAIEVCGVAHVGIGSDFDGGSGMPGLEDASRMLKITEALIDKGFTDEEITAIWGWNFIRVMENL